LRIVPSETFKAEAISDTRIPGSLRSRSIKDWRRSYDWFMSNRTFYLFAVLLYSLTTYHR